MKKIILPACKDNVLFLIFVVGITLCFGFLYFAVYDIMELSESLFIGVIGYIIVLNFHYLVIKGMIKTEYSKRLPYFTDLFSWRCQ